MIVVLFNVHRDEEFHRDTIKTDDIMYVKQHFNFVCLFLSLKIDLTCYFLYVSSFVCHYNCRTYRHSLTYTIIMFWKLQCKLELSIHMIHYIQGVSRL